MNKNILLLLPIFLIVSACESYGPGRTPIDPKKAVQCKDYEKDNDMKQGEKYKGPKIITIVANKGAFLVAPPHLCVFHGDAITVNFSLEKNAAKGTATISPKTESTAPWLKASNPGGMVPQKATISVDGKANEEVPYEYKVTVIGWGVIDPMITVKE